MLKIFMKPSKRQINLVRYVCLIPKCRQNAFRGICSCLESSFGFSANHSNAFFPLKGREREISMPGAKQKGPWNDPSRVCGISANNLTFSRQSLEKERCEQEEGMKRRMLSTVEMIRLLRVSYMSILLETICQANIIWSKIIHKFMNDNTCAEELYWCDT